MLIAHHDVYPAADSMIVPTESPPSKHQQLWFQVILPIIAAVACLVFTLKFFTAWPSHAASSSDQPHVFCKPDGTIVLPYHGVKSITLAEFRTRAYLPAWDPSLFLDVVYGFGELTFSAAKATDFGWDLVVGRGGQFWLAYIVYGVVRRSLTYTMETHELALPAVAFTWTERLGPGMLWWMVRCYLRPSGKPRIWLLEWRLLLIVFSCCYVLLFASLVSIMTGYQAILKPYVQDPGGTQSLLPTDELYVSNLVVIDGSRIGEHDNFATSQWHDEIPVKDNDSGSLIYQYFSISYALANAGPSVGFQITQESSFLCESRACSFTNGTAANNITWHNKTWHLDHFLGIIFQEHLQESSNPGAEFGVWSNNNSVYEDIASTNQRQIWFAINDTAITSAWVAEHSVCQTLNTYQWGFSSLLLFTFCVFTVLFTLALVWLQLEVYWRSRVYRAGSDPSTYHDILALADELHDVLPARCWKGMTRRELMAAVKDARVSLAADDLPLSRREETPWALVRLRKRIACAVERLRP